MESTRPGMEDREGSRVAGDRGVSTIDNARKSAASYRRAARDANTKKDAEKVEFGATERRARVTSHETLTTTGRGRDWRKLGGVGLALVGSANSFLPGLEQGPRSGARGLIRSRVEGIGIGINKGSTPSTGHPWSSPSPSGGVPMLLQHPGAATSEIGNRGCCHLEQKIASKVARVPRRPRNGRRLRKQNGTKGLHLCHCPACLFAPRCDDPTWLSVMFGEWQAQEPGALRLVSC